jgi:hypothetical protein
LHTCILDTWQNNSENLRRILALPHTLQWEKIGRVQYHEIATLLPNLPTLTSLDILGNVLSRSLVSALPHLQSLSVTDDAPDRGVLHGCPQLTELNINTMYFVIHDFYEPLPPLHTLSICPVVSLKWLSRSSIRTSLQKLTLGAKPHFSKRISSAHLQYLEHLSSLRELSIDKCVFEDGLEQSAEFEALCIPSTFIPTLRKLVIR